jgi:hypothetical protein
MCRRTVNRVISLTFSYNINRSHFLVEAIDSFHSWLKWVNLAWPYFGVPTTFVLLTHSHLGSNKIGATVRNNY